MQAAITFKQELNSFFLCISLTTQSAQVDSGRMILTLSHVIHQVTQTHHLSVTAASMTSMSLLLTGSK